jgi:alpha-galactosidase
MRTTLQNDGAAPSVPIDQIMPLRIAMEKPDYTQLRVLHVSGGITDAYLPSRAYAETLSFGRRGWSEPWRFGSGPDGRSSNGHLPVLAFAIGEAALVAALEWSGEWEATLDRGWLEGPTFTASLSVPVRRLTLEPGEALALPAVHLAAGNQGLDEAAHVFRRHVYERVCPPLEGKPPLPVAAYDHWFGIEQRVNSELLRKQTDWCAKAGLEYFVVDSGWYGGEFWAGAGNWEIVHQERFPEGLDALAAYVRERGLKFGLWFEPERVAEGTALHRAHPEWCWAPPDDPARAGAQRMFHLDLTRRDAQDYVLEMLSGWIRRLDIRFLRWDYNIGPRRYWEQIDPTGKVAFRYLEGLYRVLDTLLERFPTLLLECCSSGGRRIDLGTLRRAHSCVIADHAHDPEVCRFMQSGFNRFLPGHLASASLAVPLEPDGSPSYPISDHDLVSRMGGSIMFNGHVASWDERWSARAAELIALFREIRHLLVQRFVRLLPQPQRAGQPEAFAFVAESGEEAIVLAFTGPNGEALHRVAVPFVDASATYAVENLLSRAEPESAGGAALRERGLATGLTAPESSGIWRLRRA